MNSRKGSTPQRSIQWKINIIIIIVITASLAAFATYNFFVTRAKMLTVLSELAELSAGRMSETMADPLWNIDENQIVASIKSEMIEKRIYAILVNKKDGKTIISGFKRDGDWQSVPTTTGITGNYLSVKRDIIKNGEKIGTVEVFFTLRFILGTLKSDAIGIASITIVLNLFLITALSLIMRHFLNPLKELSKGVHKIGEGDLTYKLTEISNDEIGILAKSINTMAQQLALREQEQLKTARVLQESEEKYKTLVEKSPLGISVIDKDNCYTYLNSNFMKMFGYTLDDITTGKDWFRLAFPDNTYRKTVIKKWTGDVNRSGVGESRPRIFNVVCKDGKVKTIDFKPVALESGEQLVMYEDITERKKSQELMIQTEKMMSVGGLAAGMAHEINNPLGGMLQGVQNVQRRLSPELKSNLNLADEIGIDLQKLQPYLEKRGILSTLEGIRDSGKKATQIISSMLQFSRRSESKMMPLSLPELVENALDLASKDYNLKKKFDFRNIRIVKKFDANLPMVSCTETEIEQVILNLLSNSAWAMNNDKNNKQPQIILRMKHEGEMVQIEVEDNGPGMDEDVKKHVFEPFYTTKSVGEGTGLGLSVSFMIISNNHKGTMEVESELGKGTKFIIRLPLEGI